MARIPDRGGLVSGLASVFRGEIEEDVMEQATGRSKTARDARDIPGRFREKARRLYRDWKNPA